MKKAFGLAVMTVAVVFFAGCSSLGPKVVEKSGSKEKWVKSENIHFEDDGALYFRGEVSGVYDLTLGRRQAEADAKKRITEAISSEITVEYREFIRGSNTAPGDVGKFVEDMLQSTSANVRINGLMTGKSYWERLADNPKEDSKPYYRIYTLIKISKEDYKDAKERVISGILEKARVDKNTEAERLLEEWKKQRGGAQ